MDIIIPYNTSIGAEFMQKFAAEKFPSSSCSASSSLNNLVTDAILRKSQGVYTSITITHRVDNNTTVFRIITPQHRDPKFSNGFLMREASTYGREVTDTLLDFIKERFGYTTEQINIQSSYSRDDRNLIIFGKKVSKFIVVFIIVLFLFGMMCLGAYLQK